MKVSVIVPVYNVEQYLPQCVDSILAQTYKDLEVILVDDGSPDGSPAICDEYARRDPRVRVIHKKNGGLSDARNFGIDASTGEYLLFIDSDDYWDDPEGVEKCVALARSLDADVVNFGFKKYYQDTGKFETVHMNIFSPECTGLVDIGRQLKYNVFITSACNKLVKASLFKGADGIRFVKGQLSEDIEYCSLLLLRAHRFTVVPRNFYVYRQARGASITATIGKKNITDIASVISKYVAVAKEVDDAVPLLNYLSLQYILWLTCTNFINKKEIKDLLSQMRPLWWLTRYDWCPYVRKVRPLRWLGFYSIRHLLGLYKKMR